MRKRVNTWFLLILVSAVTLSTGCSSLSTKRVPAGLTAEDVASIIDERLGQYQETVDANREKSVAEEGVNDIVDRLKAANFNHPAIAVKREVRGCVIQMVLYADTDVDTATSACMRIYNRKAPASTLQVGR